MKYVNKKDLHDSIVHLVEDYENKQANGKDLYDMLIDVLNNWEEVITATND